MPVEFERIEHNPPGGTLSWMAYMFIQSLKATLTGTISTFLMSFPALLIAVFIPGGLIAYAVFVVTIGISTGGIYKDFSINVDWDKIESGFDSHRQKNTSGEPSEFTRNTIVAMIFGGTTFFAIMIISTTALFVAMGGPLLAIPLPYFIIAAEEYANEKFERSAVSPGIKLTKWMIFRLKSMSAQQRTTVGLCEDIATILMTTGVGGRDRQATA